MGLRITHADNFMKHFTRGQIVRDLLNKCYVRIVEIDKIGILVDWIQDEEIARYTLPRSKVRKLSNKEIGYYYSAC